MLTKPKTKPATLGACIACGATIPRGSTEAVVVGIGQPGPNGDNKMRVCDVECAQVLDAAARARRRCVGCGVHFTPKRPAAGSNYCTKACERAADARRRAVWTGVRENTLPGTIEALSEALADAEWLLTEAEAGNLTVPPVARHRLVARRAELEAIKRAVEAYAAETPAPAGITYARGADGTMHARALTAEPGDTLAAFLARETA